MDDGWDVDVMDLPTHRAVEATRLVNLYITLTHGRVTLEEVRSAFAEHDDYRGSQEASRKAFRRDCDKLRSLGFDIREHDDRYWITPHSIPAGAVLSPAERSVVALTIAAMHPVFDQEARSLLLSAAAKLGILDALAPPEPALASRIDPSVLAVIDAARIRRPLRFEYENAKGERTRRTVHPWACLEYDHRWFFRGFDEHTREPRTFRADRIVPGTHAIERKPFHPHEETGERIVLEPWMWGNDKQIEAVVRLAGDTPETRLPATRSVDESEGHLVLGSPIIDLDAFITWVLRRYPNAVIVGPRELREGIVARLGTIADQHEAPVAAVPSGSRSAATPPRRRNRGAGVRRAAMLLHILGMTEDRLVPLSELADALGISEEALHDLLVQIHYYTGLMPLYGDEANEAWIEESSTWTLAPAAPYVGQLSNREAAVLGLAVQEMLLLPGLPDQARTQLEDVLRVLGFEDAERHRSMESPELHDRLELVAAVSESRVINFSYRKADTEEAEARTVEPWRLIEALGATYLFARDIDRDAPRWFRLDRLDDLVVTGETFSPPPVDELPETFEAVADEASEPIVVRIPRDHVAWARERFGPDTVTEDEADTILRIPSSRPEQLVPTLLALAPDAETLAPPGVRAMVADAARSLLAAHR